MRHQVGILNDSFLLAASRRKSNYPEGHDATMPPERYFPLFEQKRYLEGAVLWLYWMVLPTNWSASVVPASSRRRDTQI